MTETTGSKFSPLELARLKAASEDYKVHKSIFVDPVTEEPLEGFKTWPEFRDEFLADWKSNRRVVTEKEADVHFDKIADESLAELENIGAPTDVAALAEQVATDSDTDADDSATGPFTTQTPHEAAQAALQAAAPTATAPKRRGRPPGSGKLKVVASNDEAPAAPKRRGRPPGSGKKASTAKASKPALKKVAAKKKGGGTSAKAQAIIEKYGPAGRKWARKDVIEKLVNSIDGLGAAYASTLYQKFA
jgi:hypothetical protein